MEDHHKACQDIPQSLATVLALARLLSNLYSSSLHSHTAYAVSWSEWRGRGSTYLHVPGSDKSLRPRMAFPGPVTAPSFPQASLPQARPPSGLQSQSNPGLRLPTNKKTIYDRNLNRSRNAELSRSSFAYLFMEMVSYAQKRVTGIQDLEKR